MAIAFPAAPLLTVILALVGEYPARPWPPPHCPVQRPGPRRDGGHHVRILQ